MVNVCGRTIGSFIVCLLLKVEVFIGFLVFRTSTHVSRRINSSFFWPGMAVNLKLRPLGVFGRAAHALGGGCLSLLLISQPALPGVSFQGSPRKFERLLAARSATPFVSAAEVADWPPRRDRRGVLVDPHGSLRSADDLLGWLDRGGFR